MEYFERANHRAKTDRIVLNVSGLRFETRESTLARFPNTLLGCRNKRERYFDRITQEYFFARNRQIFDAILYYYQSNGRLVRPSHIPESIFFRELRFFEIGKPEDYISFSEIINRILLCDPALLPRTKYRRFIWLTFSDANYSFLAKVIALWNVITLLVSTALACIETMPSISQGTPKDVDKILYSFNLIDTLCYVWFTFEYGVRLVTAQAKWKFCKNILNLVDAAALIPFFTQLLIKFNGKFIPLSILRIIRIARTIRLLKFSRYSRGMRALFFSVYKSWKDLQLLGLIMCVVTLLSASLVYYADRVDKESLLVSIPESMWWAVNTITTVGYGDTYPSTGVGKTLGGLFSMLGTMLLGLPIYCLVTNFLYLWESAREQDADKEPPT